MTKTGIDGEFGRSAFYCADFYVLNNEIPIYSTKPPRHKPEWSPINAGRLAAAKVKEIAPELISTTSVPTSKFINVKAITSEFFIKLRKFDGNTGIEKPVSQYRFQQFVRGFNQIAK
jgi:hypothetical protein